MEVATRCGSVVKMLATETKDSGFTIFLVQQILPEKLSLFNPAVTGYPTLFRAGKSEACEEEEWRPTSATLLAL